jgi:hypothetical protein
VKGNEYLCPMCRIKLPLSTVNALRDIDKSGIFHFPITKEIAQTYFDVIRNPMDLQTMRVKASRGQYKALQALRADFELMCLNALTFNKPDDEYWTIARLFYNKGISYFSSCKRTTSSSAYGVEVRDLLKLAKQIADGTLVVEEEKAKTKVKKPPKPKELYDPDEYKKSYVAHNRKNHERGVSASGDNTTVSSYAELIADEHGLTKKRKLSRVGNGDGVADAVTIDSVISNTCDEGTSQPASQAVIADLPTSLYKGLPFGSAVSSEVVFMYSMQQLLQEVLPYDEHIVSTDVAFYSCCRDVCSICASSGSPEYFLFCMDCGEGFHSFCVDIPLPLMLQQEARLLNLMRKKGTKNLNRFVSPRNRWKCVTCNVTCASCQGVACRSPVTPLPAGTSLQEGLRQASMFVSCSVCSTNTHVGCIPHLSANGWINLGGGSAEVDGKSKLDSWVCSECCLCTTCLDDTENDMILVGADEVTSPAVATRLFVEKRIGKTFFTSTEIGETEDTKLWGFSAGQCLQCTIRDYFLQPPIETRDDKIENAHLNRSMHKEPGLTWAPSSLQVVAEVCGECKQTLAGRDITKEILAVTCCSLCFAVFHSSCCKDQHSHSVGELFVCKTCRKSEHVLMNGFSHVGKGQQAADILHAISDIQQYRKDATVANTVEVGGERATVSTHKLEPSLQPASFVQKKRMLMLMVLVAWAARRLHFISSNALVYSHFASVDSSTGSSNPATGGKNTRRLNRTGNSSVGKSVHGKSIQFLRLWMMMEGGKQGKTADEAHKISLMQGSYELCV